MLPNEMLEEIWKTRDEHARRFNYDLDAIFQDLRKQQEAGKRKVVSFINTSLELKPDKALHPTAADDVAAELHR
jgi:hypothetical protein